MAKQTSELRRYAVIGAEQRLLQISGEAEAIFRSFPELRGTGRSKTSASAVDGGEHVPWPFGGGAGPDQRGRGPGRPRKRRTMSADARRRISEAQKARWAKQKRENGAATKRASTKKK